MSKKGFQAPFRKNGDTIDKNVFDIVDINHIDPGVFDATSVFETTSKMDLQHDDDSMKVDCETRQDDGKNISMDDKEYEASDSDSTESEIENEDLGAEEVYTEEKSLDLLKNVDADGDCVFFETSQPQESPNKENQGIIKYAQFSFIFYSIFLYYFSLEVA